MTSILAALALTASVSCQDIDSRALRAMELAVEISVTSSGEAADKASLALMDYADALQAASPECGR